MNKTTKILLAIAGVIILAFFLSLALLKLNIINNSWFQPKYVMVYLNSGDVYFGRMTKFSMSELSDVLFLQKDPTTGKLSVQKFKDSIWQPENTVHFEKQQIAFWSYLKPESPIIQLINGELSSGSIQTQEDINKTSSSTPAK